MQAASRLARALHLFSMFVRDHRDATTGEKPMFTEASGVRDEGVVEERIWQAVIVSTIEEWMSGPLRRSIEAEQFLFRDDRDFHLVCQQAGMDAARLRQRLVKLRDRLALRPDSNLRRN
jgi:hypothetical protein